MAIKFFKSNHCTPCKMMEPIMKEVSEELAIEYQTIDTDTIEGHEISKKYKVDRIPTIIKETDGEVKSLVGLKSKDVLLDFLKNV